MEKLDTKRLKSQVGKAAKSAGGEVDKAIRFVNEGGIEKSVKKGRKDAKKFVDEGGIEKSATKALDTVKGNPNTFLIIGGILVGGYLLSKLGDANILKDAGENIVGADQPKIDNTKPTTFNKAQASQIAETLYAAMYSAGTEEQRIYDALKDMTYNNWVMVKNAFGQRRYNMVTGEGSFFPAPLASLGEWINAELTPDELKKLAQIAPEVFK